MPLCDPLDLRAYHVAVTLAAVRERLLSIDMWCGLDAAEDILSRLGLAQREALALADALDPATLALAQRASLADGMALTPADGMTLTLPQAAAIARTKRSSRPAVAVGVDKARIEDGSNVVPFPGPKGRPIA